MPRKKNPVPYVCPAQRVINKFGGAYKMSGALAEAALIMGDNSIYRSVTVIFRWTYPKSRGGTGGVIPSSAVDGVKKAARISGVLLEAGDFF